MTRAGRRNRPFYRIQVQDLRERRDGHFIEQIGWYDPIAADEAKQLKLDEDRVKYWLGVGAQPSPTLRDVLAKRKLIDTTDWEAERARSRKRVEDAKAAAAAAPAAEGEAKAPA
jgi:small subunit ribosomal protein S16